MELHGAIIRKIGLVRYTGLFEFTKRLKNGAKVSAHMNIIRVTNKSK